MTHHGQVQWTYAWLTHSTILRPGGDTNPTSWGHKLLPVPVPSLDQWEGGSNMQHHLGTDHSTRGSPGFSFWCYYEESSQTAWLSSFTPVMNSDLCSEILCYCSVGPLCTFLKSVISECHTRTGTLVSFCWHKLSVNLSEFTETANFLGHNGGEKLDRYQLEAERHVRTQKATREEGLLRNKDGRNSRNEMRARLSHVPKCNQWCIYFVEEKHWINYTHMWKDSSLYWYLEEPCLQLNTSFEDYKLIKNILFQDHSDT